MAITVKWYGKGLQHCEWVWKEPKAEPAPKKAETKKTKA